MRVNFVGSEKFWRWHQLWSAVLLVMLAICGSVQVAASSKQDLPNLAKLS